MARMEEHIKSLHDQVAASSQATAEALVEIRALREEHRQEMKTMLEKHNALERAFAEGKATLRGVKLGWAAAFALIGGGIVAFFESVAEFFK